jgi:hypothetical protein
LKNQTSFVKLKLELNLKHWIPSFVKCKIIHFILNARSKANVATSLLHTKTDSFTYIDSQQFHCVLWNGIKYVSGKTALTIKTLTDINKDMDNVLSWRLYRKLSSYLSRNRNPRSNFIITGLWENNVANYEIRLSTN